jgi:VCBS repeat-containing protein
VTVTPETNQSGTATITVSVSDGAATTTDTFVLTVNALNDPPNAVDETANADEGGPNVTIDVLANDTYVDGNAFAIANNTQPQSGEGSVTCSNTNCTYTPSANFNGTTSFIYAVDDGAGGTDTATVTVNVATTNDAPEAHNDSYTTAEDTLLTVNAATGVLDNDTDLDDLLGPLTTLTAAVVNEPDNGTLTLNANGSFTYAPDANYNGTDSFTYRANDGALNSSLATVTIDVTPVNDAPDFQLPASPNQTVNEDAGTQTVAGFANNISAGPANESSQVVSFAVNTDNSALFSNQPTISPSGTLSYTPAPNANGTANVTVRARDDGGTANDGDDESAPRTFAITVNAVNDIPTLTLNVNGAASASEGQTKTFSFTVTDPDPGGFTIKSGFPDCGNSGVFVSGSLTTTPTGGNFECRFPDGPAEPTVRVRVSDLQGELSNIATQNVTVADVAPTMTISGPSKAKWGQTKTFTFAITDPGEDTFDFAASYPSCGTGAILVSENMDSHGGSFKCKFIQLAKSTLAVRVEDLDGGLSNMASWQVTVKKKK